ncbi:MAG: DUF3253 domain-containing protein [Hyphomicrobiales bacterium]|nr:DUF3253 domain-containing protein [Hyphomicrobiales bacterium]
MIEFEKSLFAACVEAGPARSLCPTDAARRHAQGRGERDHAWRDYVEPMRAAARRLAEAGRLAIYVQGRLAAPHDARGAWRVALARCD